MAANARGILFSAPMVLALLAGSKTQTRRAIRAQQPSWSKLSIETDVEDRDFFIVLGDVDATRMRPIIGTVSCPYGQPGDLLWVRETWQQDPVHGFPCVVYRADNNANVAPGGIRWSPSIFMPRWASRITLELTDVRVERLTDISDADMLAEGVKHVDGYVEDGRGTYPKLWESINGAGSWDADPWVWCLAFKRLP